MRAQHLLVVDRIRQGLRVAEERDCLVLLQVSPYERFDRRVRRRAPPRHFYRMLSNLKHDFAGDNSDRRGRWCRKALRRRSRCSLRGVVREGSAVRPFICECPCNVRKLLRSSQNGVIECSKDIVSSGPYQQFVAFHFLPSSARVVLVPQVPHAALTGKTSRSSVVRNHAQIVDDDSAPSDWVGAVLRVRVFETEASCVVVEKH